MNQGTLPFAHPAPALPEGVIYRPGAADLADQGDLVAALDPILAAAPPAFARTKGGGVTSAAMTNCGVAGWWSDTKGYRYAPLRPETGAAWPPMPEAFLRFVRRAVQDTPWPEFTPDACLINFYGPGAKMGLHQDKDEKDFSQPIVTVCLGDDADFLIGGFARRETALALTVRSGDVIVMGGASRMRFHGIRKIHPDTSPLRGIAGRYSLTFRKAL